MNAESEMAGADGLGTELHPPEGCTGAVMYDPQGRPSIQHDAGTCPIHEEAGEARCDDCGHIWPVGRLRVPKHLSERLDPGGTVPAGECPDCGALAYPVGRIYALTVVVEADSREEAFNRISDEVGPEPANAHFVGEPFEVERADEYDSQGVAKQLAAATSSPRCLFCDDPDGGATHCPHCGAYNRAEPIRTPAVIREDLAKLGREYDADAITTADYDERRTDLLEEFLDASD